MINWGKSFGKVLWITHGFASQNEATNTKYLRGLLKSKFGQCPETTLIVMCKTV